MQRRGGSRERRARYNTEKYLYIEEQYLAGVPEQKIAEDSNYTVGTVLAILSHRGVNAKAKKVKVFLPPKVHCDIDMRAAAKGLRTAVYIANLLTIISNDDMFNAILDEGDEE